MYICFVILQEILRSLSVGKVLLFVIWTFICVIVAAVLFICLVDSKILRCTLDELVTKFCFYGRISRVHLVVNLLFTTVAVIAFSMRWL